MRKFIAIALASASLLGLSTVRAQDAAPEMPLQRVEVSGQAAYKLAPHEGDQYVGTFAMETGSTLKIWQVQNRLYAQLDAQPAHRLLGLVPHAFSTETGTTLNVVDEGRTIIVTQPDLLASGGARQLVAVR